MAFDISYMLWLQLHAHLRENVGTILKCTQTNHSQESCLNMIKYLNCKNPLETVPDNHRGQLGDRSISYEKFI